MSSNPEFTVGTTVIAANGEILGKVREVYPHFLLVAREGEHEDLEVPVQSIVTVGEGHIHTSINRESATSVDDVETAHRLKEGQS
jgi:uncharacterized protein YrrD